MTATNWTLDATSNFSIQSSFADYHAQITNATLQSAVDGIRKAFAGITQYQGFFGSYGGDCLTVALDAATTKIGRGVLLSGASGDDNINLTLSEGAIKSLIANNGLFSFDFHTFRTAFINVIANANPQPVDLYEPVFLFDTDSGALSFDADGPGGFAATQFATLVGVQTLTASDFEFYHPAGSSNF